MGNDERLRSFAPQHLGFSHLWLGFHAHQVGLSTSAETTSSEARQALRILRDAFDGDLPSSPSAAARHSSDATVTSTVINASAEKKLTPEADRRKKVVTVRRTTAATTRMAMKTPQTSRTLPRESLAFLTTLQVLTVIVLTPYPLQPRILLLRHLEPPSVLPNGTLLHVDWTCRGYCSTMQIKTMTYWKRCRICWER